MPNPNVLLLDGHFADIFSFLLLSQKPLVAAIAQILIIWIRANIHSPQSNNIRNSTTASCHNWTASAVPLTALIPVFPSVKEK